MSYDNSNRFALWKNKDRTEATHPHLTGKGETDKGYWVSAWFSKDISPEDKKLLGQILSRYDSNKPFISISLKPMDASQQAAYVAPTKDAPVDDFNDPVPF